MVALFDVLGYKNLIDQNNVATVASLLRETLQQIPAAVSQWFKKEFPENTAVDEIVSAVKPLVFSDTILLTLNEDAATDTKAGNLFVFFVECAFVQRFMFENGLPLRGAISYGEFYVSDLCFVGKPVVRAYELAQSQDWCGVALTVEAENAWIALQDKSWLHRSASIVIPYDVPLKSMGTSRLISLQWPAIPVENKGFPNDPRGAVVEKFSAHGKIVPPAEYRRIENTARFFSHCRPKALQSANVLHELMQHRPLKEQPSEEATGDNAIVASPSKSSMNP